MLDFCYSVQYFLAGHLDASYPAEKPARKDFPGLAALLTPKTVPVRNSSQSLLKGKENIAPTVQKQADSQGGVNLLASLVSNFQQQSNLILGQSLNQLQALAKQSTALEARGSSSESLSSQAAEPAPLPLQTQALEKATQPESVSAQNDQTHAKMSLEDFEAKNLQELKDREAKKKEKSVAAKQKGQPKASLQSKAAKPAKATTKGLKRPAAARPPPSESNPEGLGCLRCRGSHNGCATCLKPGFQGLRLSRAQWVNHSKLNDLK